MNIYARMLTLILPTIIGFGATPLYAQELDCSEVIAMAKVAGAQTEKALKAEATLGGNGYLAKGVFAVRQFELRNDKRSAAALLELLPANEKQQVAWGSLGDSMCDRETLNDMRILGALGERLARNVARAAILAPERMISYVNFALMTTNDPHSNYAIEMRRVCLHRRQELAAAVDTLEMDKKQWFSTHVMNLSTCQALSLPEAD